MLIELSGKLGDAIYGLSVAKHLHDTHGITPDLCFAGINFSDAGKAALMPLLDQPYIGERTPDFVSGADLKFSEFFFGYDHHPNIVREMMRFAELELRLQMPINQPVSPWLAIDAPDNNLTLVNYTGRYGDEADPVDWRPLLADHENLRFIGLPEEHERLRRTFGIDLEFIRTATLLDAAVLIKGCRLFIGSQSSCLAIAIGLGKSVVVESSEDYPNCLFLGRGSRFHGVSDDTLEKRGVRVAE